MSHSFPDCAFVSGEVFANVQQRTDQLDLTKIDSGIRQSMKVLNQLDGITTVMSCSGLANDHIDRPGHERGFLSFIVNRDNSSHFRKLMGIYLRVKSQFYCRVRMIEYSNGSYPQWDFYWIDEIGYTKFVEFLISASEEIQNNPTLPNAFPYCSYIEPRTFNMIQSRLNALNHELFDSGIVKTVNFLNTLDGIATIRSCSGLALDHQTNKYQKYIGYVSFIVNGEETEPFKRMAETLLTPDYSYLINLDIQALGWTKTECFPCWRFSWKGDVGYAKFMSYIDQLKLSVN